MTEPQFLAANDILIDKFSWGELRWFCNSQIGNSEDLTVGQCVLKPGCTNSRHSHPNCSEVLVVLQGEIEHTFKDGQVLKMTVGDTITLPADFPHQAKNIGATDAVLLIAYTTGSRKTDPA